MSNNVAYRLVCVTGHVLVVGCRLGLALREPGRVANFARKFRRWCLPTCAPPDDDQKDLQEQITKELHSVRVVYAGSLIEVASWTIACGSVGMAFDIFSGGAGENLMMSLGWYAMAGGFMLLTSGAAMLTSTRIDLICAVIVVWACLRSISGYETVYRYLMASGRAFYICYLCSVLQLDFKKPLLFHAVTYGARLATIPKYFVSQKQPDTSDPAVIFWPVFVFLEVLQCFFSLALVWIAQRICREVTREGILRRAKQVELRSAIKLVSRLCDSILRLDEDGRILGKARRLADLLMKGVHSSHESVAWELFEDYVLAEDRDRFVEFLRRSTDLAEQATPLDSGDDYDCYDPAEALHIRLCDSMGLSFHVELYHVPLRDISGRRCHLLGLRDVSNLPVVWNERSTTQAPQAPANNQQPVAVDDPASNPVLDLTIQRQVKIDNISLNLHAQAGPSMWLAGYTVKFKSAIQVWSAVSPPSTCFSRSAWEQFYHWLGEEMKKEQSEPEWTSLSAGAMSFKLPYLGQATSAMVQATRQERRTGDRLERLVVSLKSPSICRVVMARQGKHLTTQVPRVASAELTTRYGRIEQKLDRDEFLEVSAHQAAQQSHVESKQGVDCEQGVQQARQGEDGAHGLVSVDL
eukprot:TRINITY_DN101362_c0_g1_i1.p1 TRINITY_DN101362_c0_g1~~TRINITY_DN101362_c0_g1_i1.p1  ORF type:complete len:636 (-),score=93.59 TRINITY_DN101362_c0_g1_i1:231-2138(-)